LRHNTEDLDLNLHRRENLKSRTAEGVSLSCHLQYLDILWQRRFVVPVMSLHTTLCDIYSKKMKMLTSSVSEGRDQTGYPPC